MPIYDYHCDNCGDFEYLHKMDEKLEKCEKCGGNVTKKISPPAGFVFKGEGFYKNDYPSESRKAGQLAEDVHKKGTGGQLPHPNSLGKAGTIYNDKLDKAPTGPDYQFTKTIKDI